MLVGQPLDSYHVADPVVLKTFRVNWYAFCMEHVARRILDTVKAQFPYIERAQVQISKLNPPLGGQVYASRVTMNL